LLGAYKFNRHMTKKDEEQDVDKLTLLESDESRLKAARQGMERGRIIAEATNLARDMVNEPANFMTPSHMAEVARDIANKYGLEIEVWEREQMEKNKMGALLGVAQGTKEKPKFIMLSYKGNPSKKGAVGFVGKGLTFDSGGISLKTQEWMSDMKGDMAGGADVIAAIGAAAALKLKINLTAIVPATENLPGGRALKPGDVLKASNGKTIEVLNTDAEGRLILSDALSYAVKNHLSPLIDLATLTGACHVALGDIYAGVFSNNQALADKVVSAGSEAGEMLWQLPLPEEYKELNKSDLADVKNSGGRYGGAITAALFLQEFVSDTPWVHIDIAGPFMSEKNKGVLVKGATGFGVRTLVHLAIKLSK
jgi:leucyl aminopeptidase